MRKGRCWKENLGENLRGIKKGKYIKEKKGEGEKSETRSSLSRDDDFAQVINLKFLRVIILGLLLLRGCNNGTGFGRREDRLLTMNVSKKNHFMPIKRRNGLLALAVQFGDTASEEESSTKLTQGQELVGRGVVDVDG